MKKRLVIHSDIGTGEVRDEHIPDSELPERVYRTGSVSSRVIGDYQVLDRHIDTGEIRATKIPDAELPTRVIRDSAITTPKIGDGQVTDPKIGTGELRATKLDGDVSAFGKVGPIPDVNTEYAFGKTLVADPKMVVVHPTTDYVVTPVYEAGVSRTSITLRADVSGGGARYNIWS